MLYKKIIQSAVCAVFILAAATACEKTGSGDLKSGQDVIEGEDIDVNADAPVLDMEEANVYSVGDTVSEIKIINAEETEVKLEYTVKAAELYDDYESAGLDPAKASRIDSWDMNGLPGIYGIEDYPVVVLNVEIKNIGYTPSEQLNITNLLLVYQVPDSGKIVRVSYPCYFLHGKEEEKESGGFFRYELEQGMTLETTVAFGADLGEYQKENLYLCVNSWCDENYWKLVRLDL